MNVPIKQTIQTVGKAVDKHSPVILAGLGIGFFGGGIICAVQATPKALKLIDDAKYDEAQCQECKIEEVELPRFEMVQAAWKCYIPTVGFFILGTACIIGSVKISSGRNLALAGAASLAEKALKEYQQKVVDILGEDQDQKVREEIAKDRLIQTPVSQNSEDLVTFGSGKYLCFDSITGRYFKSDKESIREAMNNFNHDLIGGTFETLNTWFYYVGLPGVTIGEGLGWNSDRMLDIRFTSQIAENGEPCIVLDYYTLPTSAYISEY